MDKFRVLDVFAGIGGFSLGLERTGGFETVAFCEVNPAPQKVLKAHWPEVPIYGDIDTEFLPWVENYYYNKVDVVTGGFPCQDLSTAGKGAGLEGQRSGLWWKLRDVIKETKPKYAIIENVAALRSRGLDQVLGSLSTLGYDAEWHCIPASALGAPHRRDRIWIIAYPQRDKQPREEPCLRSLGRMGREFQSFPWDRDWKDTLREFRGMDDGLSYRVDRTDTLRNTIVPQIAEMIGNAILEDYARQQN